MTLPLFPADPPPGPPSARARRAPAPAARARVPPDQAARRAAVDPTRNVVLEASAGTGKTSVLVERYLNLLRAGVDPVHVLAITFTRQAAAEMRDRIVQGLRADAAASRAGAARWGALRDRLGEITISTVDAFCLSLLREFPLEADLDPGFGMADETEVPHLVECAVERTLAAGGAAAQTDPDLAMLIARLGPVRVHRTVGDLLRRRLVAAPTLRQFLAGTPRDLTGAEACRRAAALLAERLADRAAAVRTVVDHGPAAGGAFAAAARDLAGLDTLADRETTRVRAALDRLRACFLTRRGEPRRRFLVPGAPTGGAAGRRVRTAAAALAPDVHAVLQRFDRDLNVALARGVQRLFGVAVTEYRRELEARALLDFSDVLERAVELLRRMDEFARSRYRLESRYHHVLIDEFQDTSQAQWELVSLLVQSWGEGSGLVDEGPLRPSVFVVGDRKQSIYRFRDVGVAVLEAARAVVAGLRADTDDRAAGDVRFAISHSFRAVPALLAFVNDLFASIGTVRGRRDAFRFDRDDHFPLPPAPADDVRAPGAAAAPAPAASATAPPALAAPVPAPATATAPPGAPAPAPTGVGTPAPSGAPVKTPSGAPALAAPDAAPARTADGEPALGAILAPSLEECADLAAGEVVRLIETGEVRDRQTGGRRRVRPDDIAILFRARRSHRAFEEALHERGIQTAVYKGLGFFDTEEIKDLQALIRYLADPGSDLRAAALLRSRFVGLSDAALARLAAGDAGAGSAGAAGGLADALARSEPPPAAAQLGDDDRRLLALACATVPRWTALVDRRPPAEVIDHVLAESAYAIELGVGHAAQARENVKKFRSLVRRVQNRGYATMATVADHIDHLSGDVSNALVDAAGAVALMTVHAAKGLEFPVVMLVDLGRGAARADAPVRVVAESSEGEPSVSVWPFRTVVDEDERQADLEETKRLLYVAATRARDRLYLSAAAGDGLLQLQPGSLGAVLPPPFIDVLAQASAMTSAPAPGAGAGAAGAGPRAGPGAPRRPGAAATGANATSAPAARATVTWRGPSGRPHRLAVLADAWPAPALRLESRSDPP